MQSLRYLYRIGRGPSSSHTMGPLAAAERFLKEYPSADAYRVILYGSLAKTGRGHMTDFILKETFGERELDIVLDCDTPTDFHPNTMDIIAFNGGEETARVRYYSVGGGEILAEGEQFAEHDEVYHLNSFSQISRYCREKDLRIWQYVEECEG